MYERVLDDCERELWGDSEEDEEGRWVEYSRVRLFLVDGFIAAFVICFILSVVLLT